MTIDEQKLDALLATATGRLMSAAASCSDMRKAILVKDVQTGTVACNAFNEHMEVIEAVFQDVSRLLKARKAAQHELAMIAARQQGGLIH